MRSVNWLLSIDVSEFKASELFLPEISFACSSFASAIPDCKGRIE
jgi:hypothetical protein